MKVRVLSSIVVILVILSFWQIVTLSLCSSNIINSDFQLTTYYPHNSNLRIPALSNEEYSYIWNSTYGGLDWDGAYSVVECTGGGYAIAGYTYSYAVGGCDMWLLRVDTNGFPLWNRTFGGTNDERAYDIVECSDGGYALVGITASFGHGGWDAWLLRTDSMGSGLWNKTFGGEHYDEARSIVLCDDGGFAIAGTYSHGVAGWDFWLIRTDESGNQLWNRTYGGIWDDMAYSLVECSGGGFAIAGSTESYGAGQYDYWLVRVNPSGEHLWNQSYGKSGYEECWSMLENRAGGFVLTGDSTSFPTLDPCPWVVCTDTSGNQIWNYTYTSGRRSLSLTETEGGHIIFTTKRAGVSLVRLDTEGHLVWDHDSFEYTWPLSLIECSDGGFAVTGHNVIHFGGPKNFEYNLSLVRLSDPPYWAEIPSNQTVEFGDAFEYELNVSATHGVDKWWLEEGEFFSIDENGKITNSSQLWTHGYTIVVCVNDTLGNVLQVKFDVIVQDTTSPLWSETPTDQAIEQGQRFYYDLNATDLAGLHTWWVNDTTHFFVEPVGIIRDNDVLAVGKYGIEVSVNDTSGNTLSASFTLEVIEITTTSTITTTTTTEEGLLPVIILMIVSLAAVILILIIIRRKQR